MSTQITDAIEIQRKLSNLMHRIILFENTNACHGVLRYKNVYELLKLAKVDCNSAIDDIRKDKRDLAAEVTYERDYKRLRRKALKEMREEEKSNDE